MNVEIANRLIQLREKSNLSQEELAMRLGVSMQAVSNWERAEASPDTDNLIALSALYKLSVDDLLRTTPSPEPKAKPTPNQPESVFTAEAPTLDGNTYELKGAVKEEGEPKKQAVDDPLPEGSFYDTEAGRIHRDGFVRQASYPVVITTLYLILGILFGWWHPAWLLFMTIPIYYMPEREKSFPLILGNPVVVTLVYLVLGFYMDLWHPGWLIFLAIPIINSMRPRKHAKSTKQFDE